MPLEQQAAEFRESFQRILNEMRHMMVGQEEILEGVLVAFFSGGHVLLEGVPGLGKTMLVRTLADAVNLKFSRVQFTPDLMPADIIGTNMIAEDESGRKAFRFQPGPVFANIVLADEINRATPKTQSALLEAMQEHHVTVGGVQHPLGQPFLVLATQNPLEMEGTYPLPEAQLDRFFMKLHVPFPKREELHAILDLTTGEAKAAGTAVLHKDEILRMQNLVRRVPVARHVQDYAIRVVLATHPDGPDAPDMCKRFVRFGASPRGAQSVLLAAKIRSLFEGRFAASIDDVRALAHPVLRHRMLPNFHAESEGITSGSLIDQLLQTVKP